MLEPEKTITYLFGAGASKEVLPIVSEIPQSLEKFLNRIKNAIYLLSDEQSFKDMPNIGSKRQLQREFFSTIEWMINESKKHASVDTFAKKLYSTNQIADFIRLKAGLSCFFIFLQSNDSIDKRYDSFFASIIQSKERDYELPSNIRILTWNYDYQFEKTFSFYTKTNSLYENQVRLNIYPHSFNDTLKENQFVIFKLNGTTAVQNKWERRFFNIKDKFSDNEDRSLIESLVEMFTLCTKRSDKFESLLTFAWEKTPLSNSIIENATLATSKTNVLVVIGYSFPFFNRVIDRSIINSMINLEKIYIQAPKEDVNNLITRFKAIRSDFKVLNPEPIEDIKQFFLPPEL